MKTILVLGAGRSSASLISYFITLVQHHGWQLVVGDILLMAANERVGNEPQTKAMAFSIADEANSLQIISQADVVVSLLPATLHPQVARLCLQAQKHLLTASYVSHEMKNFDNEAKQKGLLFLNECGLDPGLDHMTAMELIDAIREEDGILTSFESFTGGLIAPETDPENPWRYKFTWNPRNVVMAGQGTAKFLENNVYKYIPYQQLFKRTTSVSVPGHGRYEGYANRDSLKYIETYCLQSVKTMIRGTLRNEGFCSAWNVLVQLGCCDESYVLEGLDKMTNRDFIESFLPSDGTTVEIKICNLFGFTLASEEVKRLSWSGFFTDDKITITHATPAQVVEYILNKKWKLQEDDKDQIVMWHRFKYLQAGVEKEIQAYLVATGEDSLHTAMAKTVGLPLAIAAKLLLENKIVDRGVVIPTVKSIYEPILAELKQLGIAMQHNRT
jgi:saccharopine dehydrogenase-like NADP-dependent oxidoreductase